MAEAKTGTPVTAQSFINTITTEMVVKRVILRCLCASEIPSSSRRRGCGESSPWGVSMVEPALDTDDSSIEMVCDGLFISPELFLYRSNAAAATLKSFVLAQDLCREKIKSTAMTHPSRKEAIGETRQNHPWTPRKSNEPYGWVSWQSWMVRNMLKMLARVNADGDCVEYGGGSLAEKEDPLGVVGLGGLGSGAEAADACE